MFGGLTLILARMVKSTPFFRLPSVLGATSLYVFLIETVTFARMLRLEKFLRFTLIATLPVSKWKSVRKASPAWLERGCDSI